MNTLHKTVLVQMNRALLLLGLALNGVSFGASQIGVILSTTGPAAYIGKPEEQVLKAIAGELSNVIELKIVNSRGEPRAALKAFEKLARNPDLLAIIGPSTSDEALPVAERAEAAQIPLLALAASHRIVNEALPDGRARSRKWVFKFAQNDNLAADQLLRTMQRLGHQRIALFSSTDTFGKSGADVFKEELRKFPGQTIIHEATFPPSLKNGNDLVTALPINFQAVVIWGMGPAPAILLRDLRKASRPSQIYLSHGNASLDFLKAAGASAEGAIIVGSHVLLPRPALNQSKPGDAAIESYDQLWERHKFSGSPSHFGGHARDALLLLADIIQKGQGSSRASIRDQLEATRNFEGVTGRFTFTPEDHAGLTLDAFETFRIRNGSFEPLESHK